MTTLPKLPDSIPVTANADGSPLPAESNVGRYRPRRKQGILTPSTVEDVQAVVRGFSGSALSLHAISTGRNWGLGSKEAAANDAARIELSGMREIRAINLDHGWAVIEPGVTQLDLAGKLAGTSRMLNVTASSGHTSVIGNTLDRGVGLYGPRINDLLGVEAVLPDGELVKIGWWPREDGTATALNIHGLGTSLLGLFSQSNLAVITGAVMRLHPRPEPGPRSASGYPNPPSRAQWTPYGASRSTESTEE